MLTLFLITLAAVQYHCPGKAALMSHKGVITLGMKTEKPRERKKKKAIALRSQCV